MNKRHRTSASISIAVAILLLAIVIKFHNTPKESELISSVPNALDTSLDYETHTPTNDFSEEQLRTALSELCTDGNEQSDDKEWTSEEIQAFSAKQRAWRKTISDQLSVSLSAEHLHLAALLADSPNSIVALLDRAIRLSPNDAFLLWRAVQLCSENREVADCNLVGWERRLLAIDGDNSESWIRIAANRHHAGDIDAALEALRHAATSAETKLYWTETIEMAERGFAAAGNDYSFYERVEMAFGIAAVHIPDLGAYTTMCKQQSSTSTDWAQTCLAYGQLAEAQGKTDIGISIARTIQKLAYEALGEFDQATKVEQKQQARSQERLTAINDSYPTVERILFSNSGLYSSYLASVRSNGEIAAQQEFRKEAERMLETQPELACKTQ